MGKTEKHQGKRGTIATRIAAVILGLIVISVVLSNFLTTKIAERDLIALQNKIVEENAVLNAKAFGDYFHSLVLELDTITKTIDATDVFENKDTEKKLQEVFKNSDYLNLFYVDASGNVVAFSDPVLKVKIEMKEYLKKALAGEVSVVEPYEDTGSGKMCVTIAVPCRDTHGDIKGAMGIDIELSKLSVFLSDIKVGENGYTYIINKNMDVVAHKDAGKIGNNLNEVVKKEPKLQAVIDLANKAFHTGESSGNYVVGGKKMYSEIRTIPNTDWAFASVIYRSEIDDMIKKLIIKVSIGGLILFLIMGIVGIIDGKLLARPIAEIDKYCFKLQHLDLRVDENAKALSYKRRNDEIGRLINTITMTEDSIRDLIANISSSAQETTATSEELTSNCINTRDAAEEVASAVTEIATGAGSQAEDTMKAVRDIENGTKVLVEMMDVLETLKEATNNIESKKNEGKEALGDLTRLTEKSESTSNYVGQIISETNESAEAISQASEMIQQIADQTNLLALNAAIEAARAGEAGRGFSVVAEEIRKLAEDSNRFTEEIREVIEDLKSKAGKAVENMQEVGDIVSEQNRQASITNEKFNEIEEAVVISKEIVEKVASESRVVESNNRNVIDIIENLSAIAEENAATTQQATANVDMQVTSINDISMASEGLADLASNLQAEVMKFKV